MGTGELSENQIDLQMKYQVEMHQTQDANSYIVSVTDRSEISFESIKQFNKIFGEFLDGIQEDINEENQETVSKVSIT